MKKMCFFLVVCLTLVCSVSFAETASNAKPDTETVVSTIEGWLYSEGYDYCLVQFYDNTNSNMTCLEAKVTFDGVASSMIAIKKAGHGPNFPKWVQVKAKILTEIEEITAYLESVGYVNVNVLMILVNDDIYLREDYGTDKYTNFFHASTLCFEDGHVLFDILEYP